MRLLLTITSLGEGAFGLLALISPSIVVQALFGLEIDGLGIILGRVAGIAIIGLAVACWPGWVPQGRGPLLGANLGGNRQPLYGMLTYSTLVMLYLLRIGIRGIPVGPVLWPAVILHAVLIVLLIVVAAKERKPKAN